MIQKENDCFEWLQTASSGKVLCAWYETSCFRTPRISSPQVPVELSTFAQRQRTLRENGKLAVSLNMLIFSSEYDLLNAKVQNLKKKYVAN